MDFEVDVQLWAEREFGECDLGDVRRTRRAVRYAAQVAAHPDGSTPDQTETWGNCKAVYGLMDREDVRFERLIAPHTRHTRAVGPGDYLVVQDTTFVCFPTHRKVLGLGPVGDGSGQGFLLHSGLLIRPGSEELLGLAAQRIHYRVPVPAQETYAQRMQRQRESIVWEQVLEDVGPPPPDARFIDVCDRGADHFDFYARCVQQRHDWVVRAAQQERQIVTPAGQRRSLEAHVASLSSLTTYTLSLRARPHQRARQAKLEVRAGAITVPLPSAPSAAIRASGPRAIPMYVVEVREVDPPPDVEEPLHWVLLTSLPATDAEAARRVVGYYETRWLVEEYHKALKTGCGLEQRQYETAQRLEAVTGFLSIVAIRLLQLKTVARNDPERPAEALVPRPWIQMLVQVSRGKHRTIRTVRDFYRGLARLGGFLARKRDGEPGWITLWRGFEKLHLMLRGAAALKRCG